MSKQLEPDRCAAGIRCLAPRRLRRTRGDLRARRRVALVRARRLGLPQPRRRDADAAPTSRRWLRRRTLDFHDAGSDVVVVTAHPSEIGGPEWPDETSTVIRFHEGKVVSMQDYRTEAEALAAAK